MRPDVGDGERLAEDVGPLEVAPLAGGVAGGPGLAGGGVLVGPRLADGRACSWGLGCLGRFGIGGPFGGAVGIRRRWLADVAWKRRSRRLLETTKTLERPMEAPAMSGFRSPAAASGRAATL